MNRSVIEKLDAVPMKELLKHYKIDWQEGRNFKCPFPNHGATGATPSFRLYDTNSFYCYGCNKGGGPVHFVMNMEGISYVEACDKLMSLFNIDNVPEFSYRKVQERNEKKAERRDVQLKFGVLSEVLAKAVSDDDLKKFSFLYLMLNFVSGEEMLSLSIDAMSLSLKEFIEKVPENIKEYQRLGVNVIKTLKRHQFEQERLFDPIKIHSGYFNSALCSLSWPTQENRYVFPIFLPGKVIAGFSGRTLNLNESLKYQTELLYDMTKRDIMFGLDVAVPHIREKGFCIIVEGILDAVRCWSAGYMNTVAPCCSYVSDNIAILLKGLTENFVLLNDNDYGGNEEAQRSEKCLDSHGMKSIRLMLPENEDPDLYGKKNLAGLAELLKIKFT